MREAMYHIYKVVDFEREPLCYYESEADEYGKLLEFETAESAERFIESAVASGDRTEDFFEEAFIAEGDEECEFGYIDATNLYIGIDGKLYELGDTKGLE